MSEKILQQILDEIKDMKKEQQSMKKDISAIKEQAEDIPAIKVAVLEANEIVKNIESIQENHEQILDLLSRRSIDHEAKLRNVK